MLVFPSLYEGFGLPLAEALAHGLPAIVSDIPVLRETAGGAALYLPPEDEHAWAAEVMRVSGDPSVRQELSAAARRRATELTFDRTAAGIRAVLREVAAARRP
jgi:glycosyltransferase involved in cell wall biosynthesis